MRSIFGELLASLAVLFALFVLVSEDRGVSSSSGTVQGQRTADVTDHFMQAIMLQRLRSGYVKEPSTARIIEAQQALKDDGIYSGPVDGRMSQRTREAIRSFQSSNQLNVTGTIDDDTAHQLALQQK
jgi:peptidoglycan hydrolase-like protein with peptidoglycan-binding domain